MASADQLIDRLAIRDLRELDALYIEGAHWLKGESIEAIDGRTPRLAA